MYFSKASLYLQHAQHSTAQHGSAQHPCAASASYSLLPSVSYPLLPSTQSRSVSYSLLPSTQPLAAKLFPASQHTTAHNVSCSLHQSLFTPTLGPAWACHTRGKPGTSSQDPRPHLRAPGPSRRHEPAVAPPATAQRQCCCAHLCGLHCCQLPAKPAALPAWIRPLQLGAGRRRRHGRQLLSPDRSSLGDGGSCCCTVLPITCQGTALPGQHG